MVSSRMRLKAGACRPFSSTSPSAYRLCGKDEAFLSLMRKTDQIHADGMLDMLA